MLKSKLLKLRILLKHIDHNRYRVYNILSRLDKAEDEEEWRNISKQLAREELLSPEQFVKVVDVDKLSDVADIIRDTKIGHGINFLPTKLSGLKDKLEMLLEENISTVKRELTAVLEELLRRKGISMDRYTAIKDNLL